MRWILLLVGIAAHTLVIGQSTLKIYVLNGDIRSDMDIIDLNTNALVRYGVSVDSTNMDYYTTTMSTQVLRMSKLELFGPEEEVITAGLEEIEGAGLDFIEPSISASAESRPTMNVTAIQEGQPSNSVPFRTTVERTTSNKRPVSNKSYRSQRKGKRPQKTRRNKRYKGQCPKFF